MSAELEHIQAYKEYKQKFIENRTKQEMELKASIDALRGISQEDLEPLNLPTDMSLKALVPELYKEKPDADVTAKQYEEANAILDRIYDFATEVNKEGITCMSEYKALLSRINS